MTLSLVAKTESHEFFGRLCPHVLISSSIPRFPARTVRASDATNLREALSGDGVAALPHFFSADEVETLAFCVDRVVNEGLPAVYALVFDDFWTLARQLASAVNDATSLDFEVLADFWAWHVPAVAGSTGWAPHRDYRAAIVRGADGFPRRLNAWIALTDAPIDHACISVVPLSDDPAYPADLASDIVPCGARALPVEAGGALLWDANVLHWGGAAKPSASRARMSFAFTFERPALRRDAVNYEHFGFRERLDLVADQIVRYAWKVPDMPPEIVNWARMLKGVRRVLRSAGARVDPVE